MKKLIMLGMFSMCIAGCVTSDGAKHGAAVKIEDSQMKGTVQGRGTSGVSTGASGADFNTGSEGTPK